MPIQRKQSSTKPEPVEFSSAGGPHYDQGFTGNPHSKQNQEQQQQEKKSWLDGVGDTAKSLALKTTIAAAFYTILHNFVNVAKLADPGTLDMIANNFGNADAWTSLDGFGDAVSNTANSAVDMGVVDQGDLVGHLTDGAAVGTDFGYVAFAMIGAFAAWKAAGAALSAGSALVDGAKAGYEWLKEKASGKKEEPEEPGVEMSSLPTPSPSSRTN